MRQLVTRHWWSFVLRGIVAILFGFAALAWPVLTLELLVIFFGAYAFVDGSFALSAAIVSKTTSSEDRWLLGLQGVLGIIIGLITLFMPLAAGYGLLIAIAAWALTIGVLQIMAAIRLRKDISGEIWLGLSGLITIIFGIMIVAYPAAGALSIAWLIGIYALMMGTVLIIFGFKIKNHSLPVH